MNSEPALGDALGQALLAHLEHSEEAGIHIVERDDGLVHADSAAIYFSESGGWFPIEASAPARAQGRVLDIGAGGGRFALALQGMGHEVVALDVSEGCLEVCRRRGVHNTFHGTIFDLADTGPAGFDTFLLMGHNIGLLGGPEHAPAFLGVLAGIANPRAKLIGTNRDPAGTDDPVHLAYHRANVDRGRPPGQLRLRVRWDAIATEWFDYWFLPAAELAAIAESAGWRLTDTEHDADNYLAELTLAAG